MSTAIKIPAFSNSTFLVVYGHGLMNVLLANVPLASARPLIMCVEYYYLFEYSRVQRGFRVAHRSRVSQLMTDHISLGNVKLHGATNVAPPVHVYLHSSRWVGGRGVSITNQTNSSSSLTCGKAATLVALTWREKVTKDDMQIILSLVPRTKASIWCVYIKALTNNWVNSQIRSCCQQIGHVYDCLMYTHCWIFIHHTGQLYSPFIIQTRHRMMRARKRKHFAAIAMIAALQTDLKRMI